MAKLVLTEALEALQEYDFMGGPGMEYRPDYTTGVRDPKNAPKNFRMYSGDPTGDGPWNAQGRGPRGIGRGGVGWGGRPDDSGGVREPSSAYEDTWDTQEEGADWDELDRHGEPRNKWRDSPTGRELKKMLDGQAVEEAMGVPFQTGPVAPMNGPLGGARDARPVKDENGDDVAPETMHDPVDPMRGPGNMWGGPGTIPGASRGWANAPANQKKLR